MKGDGPAATPLLRVERLVIVADAPGGPVPLVDGVSFDLLPGEVLGLVGESGAGKSLTAFALTRLLPAGVRVAGGRVLLDDRDLVTLGERELRAVRGRRIATVFQEPMTALNPTFTVGFQVAEAVRAHRPVSRREARAEAVRLLERVAVPDASRRMRSYPHELSGGQRQRVVLAMGLACRPQILLADEPTTALDVTTQAQILDLLDDLRRELGLAVLLITHDLAVVAETCDRVLVMQRGEIVEGGPVEEVFTRPSHPHTRALLEAVHAVAGAPGGAAGGAG